MKKSLKIREKYVIKFKTLKIMISPLFYNELCKFYSTPDFIEPLLLMIFFWIINRIIHIFITSKHSVSSPL